jgi:hypothetical protein
VLDTRRNRVIAMTVVFVLIGVVAVALIVTSVTGRSHHVLGSPGRSTTTTSGTGTGTGAAGTPQPPVPPGWRAHTVGMARIAVPDGWHSTSTGVGGITVAVWWPSPPVSGALPSRCVVQERPQWLLTFLPAPGDWAGALRGDLAAMKIETTQGAGPVAVTDEHPIRVAGALAALGFDAVVSHTATSTQPKLQSSDLLAALPNGTEVHVYCSGAVGTLPTHLSEGVESATLGSS